MLPVEILTAKLNAYWQDDEGTENARTDALHFLDAESTAEDAAAIIAYSIAIADTALANKKIDAQQYAVCQVSISRIAGVLNSNDAVPEIKKILAGLQPTVILASLLHFSEKDAADMAALIQQARPYATDAAGSIDFLYEQLSGDATYGDKYAGGEMPVNGDAAFCSYDNYLPVYKLMEKYFPAQPIRLLRNRSEVKGRYIYVLTFKFFPAYAAVYGNNFLAVVPPAVLADARNGKALIVYNDMESTYFPAFADELYRQIKAAGVKDVFYLLSGDWANKALRPTALSEKIKYFFKQQQWLKSYMLDYFEEAMAYSKKMYAANYSFATKYAHIKNNAGALRHFICLNRVVKDHRVYIAYFLFANNLLSKAYVSQQAYSSDKDFQSGHNENAGLWHNIDRHQFERFKQSLPWVVDSSDMKSLGWDEVPMAAVNNSFCWIITETSFSAAQWGDSFRFTEKTYKPIAYFMPFIMAGDAFALQRLRECGYKTFARWWDEGYDLIIDPVRRMHAITAVILQLSRLSQQELLTMYEEMRPTLEHNYHTFMNTTTGREAMEGIYKGYTS